MNLDEQLSQLLESLGVCMEEPEPSLDETEGRPTRIHVRRESEDTEGEADMDDESRMEPEISLFQTSREHYGVFYRLDLIAGSPQLRVFVPEETGLIKMRCYLVRPALGTPVRDWFLLTRSHDGSSLYEDTRETTEQHLLFAAGEALKRLFWGGDVDEMAFPYEVEVRRLM